MTAEQEWLEGLDEMTERERRADHFATEQPMTAVDALAKVRAQLRELVERVSMDGSLAPSITILDGVRAILKSDEVEPSCECEMGWTCHACFAAGTGYGGKAAEVEPTPVKVRMLHNCPNHAKGQIGTLHDASPTGHIIERLKWVDYGEPIQWSHGQSDSTGEWCAPTEYEIVTDAETKPAVPLERGGDGAMEVAEVSDAAVEAAALARWDRANTGIPWNEAQIWLTNGADIRNRFREHARLDLSAALPHLIARTFGDDQPTE